MAFIQIIEFKTSKYDEVDKLMDEFRATTDGTRTATRAFSCGDRDSKGTYMQIVEFPSYEAAMANSELPATNDFAKRMMDICDGPPTFRNLDVLREETL